MSWKDIIKAPYNTKAYDREIDLSIKTRLNAILSNPSQLYGEREPFDDRVRAAQRIMPGDFHAKMTSQEYEGSLAVVRNDVEQLKTAFKNLYKVNNVTFKPLEQREQMVIFQR